VTATFAKAPDFSAADYDRSRSRTYACCFSLEDSEYIWRTYGIGPRGNVAVVFDFDKLRATLNRMLESGGVILEYNGLRCHQVFSVNYGLVEYVDWESHHANATRLPNPIVYTHLKDRALFADESELRISLSALGVGKFVLNDGTEIEFPPHLHLGFDFKAACAHGVIQKIFCGPDCDRNFLRAELGRLGADICEMSDGFS
jgi:hypothetical protein